MLDLLYLIVPDGCHLLVLLLFGLFFHFALEWTIQIVKKCWVSPSISHSLKKKRLESKRAAEQMRLLAEESERSWLTSTDSEKSWLITTDSERKTPHSSSNTSLESIISLGSWAPSSASKPAEISRAASKTSVLSVCSWAESFEDDAPCSSRSSRTVASLDLEGEAPVLQSLQDRGRSRHLHQKPYSYPHVDFDLRPKERKRKPAGSPLRSNSMSRLSPTTAFSLRPITKSKGSPIYLQEHSRRVGFLDCNQQELLNWHIQKKHEARLTSSSRQSSSTETGSQTPITKSPHWGRVSSREGRSPAAIADVPYAREVGLHHPSQKLHPYSHINLNLHKKDLQRQWEGPTLQADSMHGLIPAAPSCHPTTQGKGSHAHFQGWRGRIGFLSYKEQELLEWNVHKKRGQKDSSPSCRSLSPEAEKAGMTHGYQSDWGGLGLQHLPQKCYSYSPIDYNLHEKEPHRQGKGPTPHFHPLSKGTPTPASLQRTIKGKGSHAHFQGRRDRISFLSYKEQELLEWNIHKKRQQKESSLTRRSSSPEATKAGMTHSYQTHKARLGHQHPPQKHHSCSHIDSSLCEKKLRKQRKGPTPHFHPSSKGIPTSASLQPTIKRKGIHAHFQGHGNRVGFPGSKEQELLAYQAHKKHREKEATSSQWTSRPKAQTQADVAPGWQSHWDRVRSQVVHQKPRSLPHIGITAEQVLRDWNVYKSEGQQDKVSPHRASSRGRGRNTRRSNSLTRLVPTAPSLGAEGKGSPTHLQEHGNRTGSLSGEEWALLAYDVYKKHWEKSVSPSHQTSSRAGGSPTLLSDPTTMVTTTSPSMHPADKGTGSPAHFQGFCRETGVQSLPDVPPGAIMQWVSRQLPKAVRSKAKPLDLSLPHSIMASVDKEQAMRDLHMCLVQGLETGRGRPYMEYPVCLQCGHCSPFCSHPRSRRSPSLLVYPRLSVRKGEVHMSLGFLLKIKRREADRWGLGPGVDASRMLLARNHPSKQHNSRELTAGGGGTERAQHQLGAEHRKGWETAHHHRGSRKSHSPARQHIAEEVYPRNGGQEPPPGARRVSFSATNSLPMKPSKPATKPPKPASHSYSKESSPKEARPHQPKAHKKRPSILERLFLYMKRTWAKLGVKKGKKLPSKQSSPQKPHHSRSHTEGGVLLNRKSTDEAIPSPSKAGRSHGHQRVSLQLPEAEAEKRDSHRQAKPTSSSSKQLSRKPSTTQLRY